MVTETFLSFIRDEYGERKDGKWKRDYKRYWQHMEWLPGGNVKN